MQGLSQWLRTAGSDRKIERIDARLVAAGMPLYTDFPLCVRQIFKKALSFQSHLIQHKSRLEAYSSWGLDFGKFLKREIHDY